MPVRPHHRPILEAAGLAAVAAAVAAGQTAAPPAAGPGWLWAVAYGLPFACGLLLGRRGLLAVGVGSLVGLAAGGPAAVVVLAALVECGLAAWWSRRGLPFAADFDRPRDAGRLMLAAVLAAGVRGLLTAAVAVAAWEADPVSIGLTAAAVGLLGNLLAAPPLVLWLRGTLVGRATAVDLALFAVAAVAFGLILFARPASGATDVPLPLVAAVLLAGYGVGGRHHVRGTSTAFGLAAVIGLAAALAQPAAAGATAGGLAGLAGVVAFYLVKGSADRRRWLLAADREEWVTAAGRQAERLREANDQLALQSLELADQAAEVQRQRDEYAVLARELADKRAWLESVIAQLPVGIVTADATGKVLTQNARYSELVGLPPGYQYADLADIDRIAVCDAAGNRIPTDHLPLPRAVRDGTVTRAAEVRLRQPDGGWLEMSASATPIRGAGGDLLGGVLAVEDLTAVRRAERAARDSEAKLRVALGSARMLAWEWDLDTDRVYRSHPLEEWLGLPAEPDAHARHGTFKDRIHPDDRGKVADLVDRLRAGAVGEFVVEYRLRHAAGSYVWVESRGQPRPAPGREVVGVLVDVTARRTADERLRLLESAVVHANDAIVVLAAAPRPDAGRRVLYVNQAFTRMTGYTPDELRDRSLSLLRGPGTDPHTLDRLRQALDAHRPFAGQLLNYRKDGSEVWVDLSLVPVSGADGRPAHVVMIQRDVTDRRRAEAALRRSEELFRGMFETTSAGVSVLAGDGTFSAVNPAFAAMLGRPSGQIVGRRPQEFTHPDDWADQVPKYDAVMDGRIDRYQVRKRYVRPDGQTVWTELSAAAVRGPAGEALYTVGVSVDITQRQTLEDQLRQSQKMEALGQMAGGVAHDFNNLLTAVIGNLGLVQLDDGHPARPLVRAAELAAGRAADVTRKLLGYARKNQLLIAAVRPGEMIGEVVDILRRTLDPRIRIVTRIDADCTLAADATLVNQALFNLCLNARDAMPAGGTLTLSADAVELPADAAPPARPGRFLRLSVADTGCGMDADTRRRLFEPFFTTKDVGKGTGLGLPMVHGIMTQHAGWVDVETARGVGTRFDLYLPVADATCGGDAPPRLEPDAVPGCSLDESAADIRTPPAAGPATVLLVDDEEMIRTLARSILETAGHTVVEAEDGQDAVERFQTDHAKFDLVILDLTMPRLSGRDAFRQMMAIRPDARVLFSSGFSSDDVSDADGARGYLSKPYRPGDLLAAVRRALADDAPAAVGT